LPELRRNRLLSASCRNLRQRHEPLPAFRKHFRPVDGVLLQEAVRGQRNVEPGSVGQPREARGRDQCSAVVQRKLGVPEKKVVTRALMFDTFWRTFFPKLVLFIYQFILSCFWKKIYLKMALLKTLHFCFKN
jgi:hypothetical protein